MKGDLAIQTFSLTKIFNRLVAVDGIELSIKRGELFAPLYLIDFLNTTYASSIPKTPKAATTEKQSHRGSKSPPVRVALL